MTLDQLNTLNAADFTATLGGIFEHSPWIAEAAAEVRPFADVAALHTAMTTVMRSAPHDRQLALIRAHPELAGKEAAAGTLTADSRGEQASAGLDQCTAAELAQLRALNAAYRERHGFPFVIAVRGLTRHQILAALAERIENTSEAEFDTCLQQIARIARLRLDALLGCQPSKPSENEERGTTP